MRYFHLLLKIYFVILISYFFSCSSVEKPEEDPERLYQQAEKNITSDKYQIALENLRILRNKFPYSKYAQIAQLRIADVYYLQESFAEAASSYEIFRELYPKHEKAPYALFRSGESYFYATPTTTERDLSSGQKSIERLELYLKSYPKDGHKDQAEKILSQIKNKLAEKEFIIANYYFNKDIFGAAERRFKKIISTYPNTEFAQKSKDKLKQVEGKIE